MKKILSLLFLTNFVASFGLSQDYQWPLKLDKSLSSNFGEYRPRRFHAGIDIKTKGTTGHEVLAVSDAYISRIKVSSDGYGKVMYLKLNDGNTAVYAHLNAFIPILNAIVKLEQNRLNAYSIEKYFGVKELPVQKGDLIGYTGETGGAYAPHLHFELRDANNRPLNPLSHGITIYDKRLPVPESIAIVPLSRDAVINGSNLPQIFPLHRIKTDEYELPDTIHVFGKIGLEIAATDKISNMTNKFNLFGAALSIDEVEQYRIEFDRFPFEQTHLIEVERDNSLIRLNEGDFHKLFSTDANRVLDFINKPSYGQLQLTPGYHKIMIRLFDPAKNVVKIKGTLFAAPPISINASILNWSDSTIAISLKPKGSPFPITDFVCYSFKSKGYAEQKIEATTTHSDQRNLIVNLPIREVNHRILQFIGINKLGAVSKPYHLPINIAPADYMTVDIELSISHLQNTILFQVETSSYISQQPQITLRGKTKDLSVNLFRISPTAFLSDPLIPDQFLGTAEVIIIIEGSPVRETRIRMRPNIASTIKQTSVISPDENCSLQALPTTFYEKTAFWIENVKIPVPVAGGTFIGKTYQLQPFDRPLQDSARIAIKLPTMERNSGNMGIFYYDQKEGWTYLPSRFSEKRRMFFTTVYSLEAIAIIEDTNEPIIKNVFPGNGGYYQFQDVKTLSAKIFDELAGINNEKSISMILDGKNLIFEYQPIKKNVRYILDTPLEKGEHSLVIEATDQVGNFTRKEVHFSVN